MTYPRTYKEYSPSQYLQHHIRCYWKYEKDFASGECERVFPDSSYELLYERSSTYHVDGMALPQFIMLGQLAKPVDFYAAGTARSWAVRFYPWGLQPFGDVQALSGHTWRPANDVLHHPSGELERIVQQEDDQRVIAELDAFFTTQLLSWEFDDATLQKATRHLREQKGDITVQTLADLCYVSRRQLTRKITAATGASPQQVAMRLRFEKVRDMIMHNPDISLSYLAHHCGYTDHSHLSKEFRRFADITPSAYAALFRQARPKMQDRNNVLFLQANSDEFTVK